MVHLNFSCQLLSDCLLLLHSFVYVMNRELCIYRNRFLALY